MRSQGFNTIEAIANRTSEAVQFPQEDGIKPA
jgi:hypothetical protein